MRTAEPEPIYKTIGAIIRSRRRRLEWPQHVLASRLGISRATLASIETGRQRILAHQIYAFAEALQLKISDLLPASDGQNAADLTKLSIQGEVNSEQREQIARLIGFQPNTSKIKEEIDAKAAKKRPRSSRQKIAK
jgi:transcriptional regulator with XRE-family HTH domain